MDHKKEVLKHVVKTINDLAIESIERVSIDVDDRYPDEIDIDISIQLNRKVASDKELPNAKLKVNNLEEYNQKLDVISGRAKILAEAIDDINNTELDVSVEWE